MNEQERQQAYIEAVKALSVQYGYELQAQILTDNLGGGILHKPQLALVPIANWQPPANEAILAEVSDLVHQARIKSETLNGK